MEATSGSLRTNPFKASAIAPWSDLSLASKIGVSSAALILSKIDLSLLFETLLLVLVGRSSSFSSLAALNAVIVCAMFTNAWRGDRCVCGAGPAAKRTTTTSGVNAVAWLLITASTSTATHPTRNNCCPSFSIISLLCFVLFSLFGRRACWCKYDRKGLWVGRSERECWHVDLIAERTIERTSVRPDFFLAKTIHV